MAMAIARTWSGTTRAADADRYLDYLMRTGLKEYAATPGHEGVVALRRIEGDEAEFRLVSVWRDWKAVEAFAGPRADRAVFYPEDDEFLVQRDEFADHFEVVFSEGPARRRLRDRIVEWWVRQATPALRPVNSPD